LQTPPPLGLAVGDNHRPLGRPFLRKLQRQAIRRIDIRKKVETAPDPPSGQAGLQCLSVKFSAVHHLPCHAVSISFIPHASSFTE
jgi:hypothetical protein